MLKGKAGAILSCEQSLYLPTVYDVAMAGSMPSDPPRSTPGAVVKLRKEEHLMIL